MSEASRPLSEEGNYDRVGYADWLQNNNMLEYQASKSISACPKNVSSRGQ